MGSSLLASLHRAGHRAFVADTAPVLYRVERQASPRVIAVCDPLFDAVETGELECLVSAVTVTELMIVPYRLGAEAVSLMYGFLRQPDFGVVDVGTDIAREAARLIAGQQLHRLPDALVAATATWAGLPLVTNDRRLARSGAVDALLVGDFASR